MSMPATRSSWRSPGRLSHAVKAVAALSLSAGAFGAYFLRPADTAGAIDGQDLRAGERAPAVSKPDQVIAAVPAIVLAPLPAPVARIDPVAREAVLPAPPPEPPAPVEAPAPPEHLAFVAGDGQRITGERIRAFLDGQGSPMAEFADDIVAAGVRSGVDPRLVVAISGVESTFGIHHLGFNAWGWDYVSPTSARTWPDWRTAIDEYTRELTERYDVSSLNEGFAQSYAPVIWSTWLDMVRGWFSQI